MIENAAPASSTPPPKENIGDAGPGPVESRLGEATAPATPMSPVAKLTGRVAAVGPEDLGVGHGGASSPWLGGDLKNKSSEDCYGNLEESKVLTRLW